MFRRREPLFYEVAADVRRLKNYQRRSFVWSLLTSAATAETKVTPAYFAGALVGCTSHCARSLSTESSAEAETR